MTGTWMFTPYVTIGLTYPRIARQMSTWIMIVRSSLLSKIKICCNQRNYIRLGETRLRKILPDRKQLHATAIKSVYIYYRTYIYIFKHTHHIGLLFLRLNMLTMTLTCHMHWAWLYFQEHASGWAL